MYTDLYMKFREIENKVTVFDLKTDYSFLYDELITNKIASKICKENIDEDFIKEVFENENYEGYVISCNFEYIGIIIYEIPIDYDYIEIILIGSNKCKNTIGLPIGQFLINLVEKKATKYNINLLYAKVIPNAIDFYINTGWVFSDSDEEEQYLFAHEQELFDTYDLEKTLNEHIEIIKDDSYDVLDEFNFNQEQFDIENPPFTMPKKSILEQIGDITSFLTKKLY